MEALLPLEDELPESVTRVTPTVTMMMESYVGSTSDCFKKRGRHGGHTTCIGLYCLFANRYPKSMDIGRPGDDVI